jgi:glycosyltransferase involved in cell wall biosynthesis
MRIADVCPRAFQLMQNGMRARVEGILNRLAERHEVRLFTQPRFGQLAAARALPPPGPYTNPAAALICELGQAAWPGGPVLAGAALRVTRPRGLTALLDWADVALVEFPWQFDRCARVAPPGLPLVLAGHNDEVEKFRSYARGLGVRVMDRPWLRYIERMERRAFERAALVLAVSEPDRQSLLARYGGDPSRVLVASNGADVELLTPAGPERRAAARWAFGLPDRPVALYIAAPTRTNMLGLEWVRKLAALTDRFTFLVVGRAGDPTQSEGNLVYTGEVEELPLCFDAADLSLVPIEFGGGTQLKLVESMAAGLPVVAFEEMLHGLGLRAGEHLLVSQPSTDSLLAAMDRLLADRALAERLGAAARRFAEEHLDWGPIATRVEEALLELVAPDERLPTAAPLSAAPRG